MAACRRVQRLLLLMFICGWIGSAHGGKPDAENPADNLERGKNAAGDGKASALDGASSVRRSGGWKLAEEAACREDVSRICPKHSWNNNLAVLECLQDRKDETEIAADCNHLLWNYKLNLTTDPKFESVAVEVCKTTINGLKECAGVDRGKGYLVSCLVEHRTNISEYQCSQYITKMTSIVFSDYRLICGFMDQCKDDINKLHCGSVNTGEKDIHSQGEVIACLEKGLVSEAEEQPGQYTIKEDCKKAIMRVAELSSDDFHLDRHLYFACREDRERFCENTPAGEGKVYKCLFNHKFEESMSDKVRLVCVLQKQLLRTVYSDVYRENRQNSSHLTNYNTTTHNHNSVFLFLLYKCFLCKGLVVLLLTQTSVIVNKNHLKAFSSNSIQCHPLILLSRDCKTEVQRILHQRALDVKLDPELQQRCMTDLGKWCSEKTEAGQELECLQDHLDDLVPLCREVVGNLTELESEDIQIEALLIRACEPVIQSYCHEVADNQIDTGDLMECLVANKHQKEMNEKCAVGVTHFQLIQMKDFRFSYKFKMACKEDVLKLCPNIKKKVDVVICLSTTVRNDTLQEGREQRVSMKCRKQLRVEELEMSEDIRLEPDLYESCGQDIKQHCQNVVFGNAQVIECLKEKKKQLTQQCHQKVFKLQENEMMDPELDFQLMRVCKQMIRRFCSESDAKNMLQCLKQNKNSELMDPKCKQMITKRQITQNTDYRLNPVLRKACKADIPKFCQGILNNAKDDNELEGQVISCLKLKYADQVRTVIAVNAHTPDKAPLLHIRIPRLCAEEVAAQEQTGQVEECLKINLLKISHEGCKKEVLNILKESKADIFVDPVLHTACALDIKHQCAAIPPGRGRQMSCLMEALQDKRVRLQPECKKRLQDRIDMWSYAAKVAPAEGFSDLAGQVFTSPAKNYILSMLAMCVILLFLMGLFCGRITKRVTQELKDR
uniref:Golgi apparatus protein 1 n=1 Tax=Cyprinus carpio TaxID=7962 RepID=A0A8C1UBW9_CYPCA